MVYFESVKRFLNMNMGLLKICLAFTLLFIEINGYSQDKNIQVQQVNFENNVEFIVEELVYMYAVDQAFREYFLFKTFDKHKMDSIL